MVQSASRPIYLRDADGGITPFDPERLQTRLIGAFLNAGLNEESYISGELVLALEYTLHRSPRKEAVFSCGEVDAAMIRMLESNGFPEVANIFRRSGSEQYLTIATTGTALDELFAAHLGCSEQRRKKISELTSEAMKTLQFSAASPHLLLELARHYERALAEKDLLDNSDEALPENNGGVTFSRQEIYAMLPPEPRMWVEQNILRINGVSALFPGIRFFFFITRFAALNQWSKPVTELEMTPALAHAGTILENIRCQLSEAMALPQAPPCCLTIPDMFDFLSAHAGCIPTEKNAVDFASILTANINGELYKLSFD